MKVSATILAASPAAAPARVRRLLERGFGDCSDEGLMTTPARRWLNNSSE